MVEMSSQEFRILYGTERDTRNQSGRVPVTARKNRRNKAVEESQEGIILRVHVPFTRLLLSLENEEYPAACC